MCTYPWGEKGLCTYSAHTLHIHTFARTYLSLSSPFRTYPRTYPAHTQEASAHTRTYPTECTENTVKNGSHIPRTYHACVLARSALRLHTHRTPMRTYPAHTPHKSAHTHAYTISTNLQKNNNHLINIHIFAVFLAAPSIPGGAIPPKWHQKGMCGVCAGYVRMGFNMPAQISYF